MIINSLLWIDNSLIIPFNQLMNGILKLKYFITIHIYYNSYY